MEQSISKTFDLLRFPLALLVIYLHISPTFQPWTMPRTYQSVSHHIYIMVNVVVCSIAQIAVPCFFMISAFLLVANIGYLTFHTYLIKLRHRFLTLFMPYIFWNIIAWGYLVIVGGGDDQNTLSFIFLSPANFPLWFLRNLIVMNIVFPLFFWLAKYGGKGVFLIIIVLYSVWPFIYPLYTAPVDNYTLVSFVFFYLGMYFGINKTNISSIPIPTKFLIVTLGILLFLMRIALSPDFAKITHNTTLLFIVFSTFIIANYIVVKYRVTTIAFLASSTFYIYLSHKVGATYLSKQIFCLMPSHSYLTQLAIFLFCPLITSVICIGSFHFFKQIVPKPALFLIGAK